MILKEKELWLEEPEITPNGVKKLLEEYEEILFFVNIVNEVIGVENNQPMMENMYKLKLNIEGFRDSTFTNLFYKEQTKMLIFKLRESILKI